MEFRNGNGFHIAYSSVNKMPKDRGRSNSRTRYFGLMAQCPLLVVTGSARGEGRVSRFAKEITPENQVIVLLL